MDSDRIERTQIRREEIRNKVKSMKEEDIINVLSKAFTFTEKPRILLYTNTENSVYGYLKISNKILQFKIWFSIMYNDITIEIGKSSKHIKEE